MPNKDTFDRIAPDPEIEPIEKLEPLNLGEGPPLKRDAYKPYALYTVIDGEPDALIRRFGTEKLALSWLEMKAHEAKEARQSQSFGVWFEPKDSHAQMVQILMPLWRVIYDQDGRLIEVQL